MVWSNAESRRIFPSKSWVWYHANLYGFYMHCLMCLIRRLAPCSFHPLPSPYFIMSQYLVALSPTSSTMSLWSNSFSYPDNRNNRTSITWHRFYSSSASWPWLLRRYHWASHVWKRRRASLRFPSPFPPRRWLTPGLVPLVDACCWMCVPRTAVPENLPPRALPHRRGPEHSLRPLNPGLLVRDWEAKSGGSLSS